MDPTVRYQYIFAILNRRILKNVETNWRILNLPAAYTVDELESSFQRGFNDYNEARKYRVSEPLRFADCENKLIDIISKFRQVKRIHNHLYPELVVKLKVFESMLELLRNDNGGSYLTIEIVFAFQKLTLKDTSEDAEDETTASFVESLVEYGALDVFVSTLVRFSEYEDIAFPLLKTIGQMIYVKRDVAEMASKKRELINWVLDSLRWDYENKYVVELLTVLLEDSSRESRLQIGQMGAVAVVVNALSSLVSSDEEDEDDEEEEEEALDEEAKEDLLRDLFHCLFCLLKISENKVRFADAGGVQLMINIFKEDESKYYHGTNAIAALGMAVKNCPCASEKFVNDAFALDVALPASIDTVLYRGIAHTEEEIEEHFISLIESLTGGITESKKDTLLKKFEENDCERIAWIMELLKRRSIRVAQRMTYHEDYDEEEIDKSELYGINLKCGFSILQSIAVILGYLWSSKNCIIRAGIESQLSHHNLEKEDLRDILSTYLENDHELENTAKTVIMNYIDSLEEYPDQGIERLRI